MGSVEEIDPCDEVVFDQWFAVLHATDMERWPDKPGWQRVERFAMATANNGAVKRRLLVARDQRDRVIGCAEIELARRENLHLAQIDVRVLPEYRRRGVGSALLEMVEGIVAREGRRELGGMDETPVRLDGQEPYEDAAGPFARSHGFACIQQLVRRELALPACPDPDPDRARPPGYTMRTFVDRWPDELIEDRCELGRRMSTDVPMGEQDLDEEVWDEARVRQMEAAFAAQNRAKVITVARHDETGRSARRSRSGSTTRSSCASTADMDWATP
jgi:GNAT superfamily N-acetyltransferase